MGAAQRTPRAAFVLAALIFGAWLPRESAERTPAECRDPAELAAAEGWTLQVACGAGADGLPELRGPARRLFALPLDPNLADAGTLEMLPGIGPARAEAIVRERARRPFANLSGLVRVRGIGPRTVAGLAGLVAVGPRQERP